jgi:hypothetical protein
MSLTQQLGSALSERQKQIHSTVQYSKKPGINYSTVQYSEGKIVTLLRTIPDVVPDDGYDKFYIDQFRALGYERFIYLANRARYCAESRPNGDPRRLFCWMLKNPHLVK